MLPEAQFSAFKVYARDRLRDKSEVFVLVDDLIEACAFHRPFWTDLEQRWCEQPQEDFDYEPQAPARTFDSPEAPYEPTVIRFWRKLSGKRRNPTMLRLL